MDDIHKELEVHGWRVFQISYDVSVRHLFI